MSRALDLRESQLRALMRAARKEGVCLEVKVGQATVTVIPAVNADKDDTVDAQEDFRL